MLQPYLILNSVLQQFYFKTKYNKVFMSAFIRSTAYTSIQWRTTFAHEYFMYKHFPIDPSSFQN